MNQVFRLAEENHAIEGCTVSKKFYEGDGYYIYHFSLAADTNISPESYDVPKLLIGLSGETRVFTQDGREWRIKEGDVFLIDEYHPYGMSSENGSVYTEITIHKESRMNKGLEAGKIFALKDLLPYQEGRIVNMDIVRDDKLKFVLMSFDEGTGLSDHSAPGEALIFALEGEGIIGYEGVDHVIKAGENFKFAAGGRHNVRAKGRFKMALLLILSR